ncbi:esterase [Mycolicibacter heraklionensis]|uniref:Esterase n=1 Tax=Mycolicibacter heraklionensis TaxID=512402 RepID=A0AA91IY57_9MYCO|nr:alpha/beta hydrolase [Mycolicibacter heraklionensis]OBK85947.1 esterase [Mycolicibacter heraklionensis]
MTTAVREDRVTADVTPLLGRARRGASTPGRRRNSSMPDEVVENGPSLAGQLVGLAARLSIWPILAIGSQLPKAPWPWGLVDHAARVVPSAPGSVRHTIRLPYCTARLVRAAGVLPADGIGRVVLYLHGGAFLTCGVNTHDRLITTLSKYADSPALAVNYRKIPTHSVGAAIDDCYEGYQWLRRQGYAPDQIVVAGDSAGGYLALALARRLLDEAEQPAALVCMSPLTQIAKASRRTHSNSGTDAMFPAKAFDALVELVTHAAERRSTDGTREEVFEPLDHIESGMCPTLIHVSGSEVMLQDAKLVAHSLAGAGVPVQLRVWPGQMHVFQIAGPMVPEADRSLRQIGRYIRDATAWMTVPDAIDDYVVIP